MTSFRTSSQGYVTSFGCVPHHLKDVQHHWDEIPHHLNDLLHHCDDVIHRLNDADVVGLCVQGGQPKIIISEIWTGV
jgi:hypothetical protein